MSPKICLRGCFDSELTYRPSALQDVLVHDYIPRRAHGRYLRVCTSLCYTFHPRGFFVEYKRERFVAGGGGSLTS